MVSRRRGRLAAALLALAIACGDGGPPAPEGDAASADIATGGPIILVSIDTLRSDHLPAYGHAGVETPSLDRLRRDGVLFARAYSPVPLTTPAHVSMMTGLLPPRHGVRDNAGYTLAADGAATLAARLAGLGYRTGGAVSSFTMRAATGLGHGFDFYDDRIAKAERATLAEVQRAGPASLDALLPWLRQTAAQDGRFFAFLHLYEPHTPWAPPAPFDRYADPYDGEIAAADAVVGRLLDALDALGRYDEATVVVVSDHGEGLGDHGEKEHGILLYREALQVPLIIKLAGGRRAGATVEAPVGLTDLMPTLVVLAGGSVAEALDGRSLVPALAGNELEARPLYGESFHPQLRYGWAGLTSLIEGRWHLIEGPDPELYDLVADPAERNNQLLANRRVYAGMKAAIEKVATAPAPPSALDEETRKKLESLGYLGSSRGTTGPLPDPKSQLPTLEPLRRGIDALAQGDRDTAIRLIRQSLETNDRFEAGWTYLGLAYEEGGDLEAAWSAYKRAFDLSSGSPTIVDALARVALRLGRLGDASTFLDMAIANHPDDVQLRFLATRTLLFQRRFAEALTAAEAALALAPDDPDARYQLAAAAMGAGDLAAAERHFLGAIEAAGGAHPPALQDLAVLYLSQGRQPEARRLLERLVRIQPDNQQAREQLRRLGAG